MNRQYLIAGIIAALILLFVGAGILIYGSSQGATLPIPGLSGAMSPAEATPTFEIPKVKVTPPPDLSEIAAQIRPDYPELADMLENPELSSVYKDFYLAYQQGGEETAVALARQRG